MTVRRVGWYAMMLWEGRGERTGVSVGRGLGEHRWRAFPGEVAWPDGGGMPVALHGHVFAGRCHPHAFALKVFVTVLHATTGPPVMDIRGAGADHVSSRVLIFSGVACVRRIVFPS